MLGRTNITTVKGGTIVSDISDYKWNDAGTLNINSSFKKAFYANNILVAITKGGSVIFTRDGENWEEASPNIVDVEYKIRDGIWDGHRFIFVGHHSTDREDAYQALIVITEDFLDYEILRDCTGKDYIPGQYQNNFLGAYAGSFQSILLNEDSTYVIVCVLISTSHKDAIEVGFLKGKLENLQYACTIIEGDTELGTKASLDDIEVKIAKNTDLFMVYIKAFCKDHSYDTKKYYKHSVGVSDTGQTYQTLEGAAYNYNNFQAADIVNVFECKDSLYYMTLTETNNYLVKMRKLSDGKNTIISTGKNWDFVDAVYFNRCEIFINAHQMLVVKPGENIADKTENDLVDISYDTALRAIIKAFEKIYIFGTDGSILVSSDEIRDENAVAVKTMTAVKALYEAKEYTNKKYAELEERVSKLEELKNNSTEV